MTKNAESISLTLQEHVLADSMIKGVGSLATGYVLRDGLRRHTLDGGPELTNELIHKFSQDPKESLAWARESLISIAHDSNLSPESRNDRFERYLNAYTTLTVKLDRAAFPPTGPGLVRIGNPSYVPDGFNDLGRESALNSSRRGREMIHVDKTAIFDKYKPLLKQVFTQDYTGYTLTQKKKMMAQTLAQGIYFGLSYDHSNKDLGPGKTDLATLNEGVCRHQALVFQVLAQAVGLKTELLKSELIVDDKNLGYHSSNLLRIDGQWYIFDVTNPDYVTDANGDNRWKLPGAFRINRSSGNNRAFYEGTHKHSGQKYGYKTHDRMFWTID